MKLKMYTGIKHRERAERGKTESSIEGWYVIN